MKKKPEIKETVKPVVTSELFIQFDSDEPIKINEVTDKKGVNINLEYDTNDRSAILFKGQNNKMFKIFLKNK